MRGSTTTSSSNYGWYSRRIAASTAAIATSFDVVLTVVQMTQLMVVLTIAGTSEGETQVTNNQIKLGLVGKPTS